MFIDLKLQLTKIFMTCSVPSQLHVQVYDFIANYLTNIYRLSSKLIFYFKLSLKL